jgi:hypothetical protein
MSGCGCIIEKADNLVDFSGSEYVILGNWVVVLFHEI